MASFLTFLVAFVLCLQSNLCFASNNVKSSLENELLKIRYELEYRELSADEIKLKSMIALNQILADGYSSEEIQSAVFSQLKNETLKKDLQKLIALMKKQNLSQEQMWEKIFSFLEKSNTRGAAFVSEVSEFRPWQIFLIGMALFVVGLSTM